MPDRPTPSQGEMSADPAILDAAVRAFLRDNPMRGYCTCFGCVATINANYRALTGMTSEPHQEDRS